MKNTFKTSSCTLAAALVAAAMATFTLTAHSADKKVVVAKAKPSAKSKAAPAPATPLPALGADELAIAQKVETGKIDCELGADVTITADVKDAGYFDLGIKGKTYKMAPVISKVGAIRLEEVRGGDGMWLQLSNKSMLMRAGNRVADECMSTGQALVADGMKKNPPPSLLDAAPAK
jgi:hypothetical protein